MNIILTGNKGLIGTFLEKRLKEEGHKIVMGIDIRDGKNILNISDFEVKDKVDLVIHTAAHCKINQSVTSPGITHLNNVDGTFQVLEFCRKNKIPKIVSFSSSRVLNKEKNSYTASKLYGEELCKGYHDSYGIDYLIIRPSTIYAPFWDETKRLMHLFVTNALAGKDLEIYGDPKTKTLDFTYIDDFVDGVMLAINNPEWNKEYNISGNDEANIYELAKFIIQETGSNSKIKLYDSEIAQPQQVKVDTSAIEKIGYSPKIKLQEGVRRTISWYKNYLNQ